MEKHNLAPPILFTDNIEQSNEAIDEETLQTNSHVLNDKISGSQPSPEDDLQNKTEGLYGNRVSPRLYATAEYIFAESEGGG